MVSLYKHLSSIRGLLLECCCPCIPLRRSAGCNIISLGMSTYISYIVTTDIILNLKYLTKTYPKPTFNQTTLICLHFLLTSQEQQDYFPIQSQYHVEHGDRRKEGNNHGKLYMSRHLALGHFLNIPKLPLQPCYTE